MIHFLTWRWGQKYSDKHVRCLAAAIKRKYAGPYRFACITDRPIDGIECWPIPNQQLTTALDGCWARLRMFDPAWQIENGISRAICLDLDLVVVDDPTPIVERNEDFIILKGGHFNPCPYNGSVMSIQAGARPELWFEFTIDKAWDIAHADGHNRGTDQTWIAANAPDAAVWECGKASGIYAMGKPGWPSGPNGTDLPGDARIVTMPGWRDPSRMIGIDWVRANWWHD